MISAIADIGNTRIKLGLFKANELQEVKHFPLELYPDAITYLKNIAYTQLLLSSVANSSIADEFFKQLKNTSQFTADSLIPIKNKYQSATTLGSDRIPPLIAARHLQPKGPILVIDAGTCIKFNFLNEHNEFIGGAISPGINMRFKALHEHTSRLPLVSQELNFVKLIGESTHESILSGVQNGAIAEVDGIINEYKKQFSALHIFLTGGDASLFEKRLKNSIFTDPYLNLKGLNIILQHNI